MTQILGPDPLPGPATTKDTWESVSPDHQVVWIGSNRTLFWHRDTGHFRVYEYQWKGVPVEADPFKDATSEGEWDDVKRKASQPKRNIIGGELLHLGNQLLLHWRPTGDSASSYRTWRLQPNHPTDPVTAQLAEGEWKSIGLKDRLVYIGGDLVLNWKPTGPASAIYNVWRLNRGAVGKQDPLPTFVANGQWSTIGEDHDVIYIGKDRMLVWERKKKVHPEEPDKKATSRYRVYRVDRTVKNFSQLLPDPVLAEGLWYTIFEDDGPPAELHRLVPIGDAELRMIDLVRAVPEAQRKARIWPIHNDIPESTGVAGVTIKRTGNLVRISVIPRKLMAARTKVDSNAPVTIEALADELRLSPQRAFQELLGFAENAATVKKLYADQFDGAAYPGFAAAGKRLASKGRNAVGSERYGYISKNQFRAWGIDASLPVLFSLSPGFLNEVMPAGAKKQQVELRLKMAQPHFDTLKKKMEALELALVPLKLHSNLLASSLESAYEDLGLLNALDALLGYMQSRPRPGDSFDATKVAKLKGLVQTLIKEHQQHCIIDPKHLQDVKKDRDQAADKVLGLLEEADLLADLQVFSDNVELSKTSLETLVIDTIRNAYELLLVSNHGDKVVDEHVRPAIMKAASLLKLTGLPSSGSPDFDAALAEDIPAPPKQTALSIFASRTAPVGTAVTNTPGPASLAVVVFHLAAPAVAGRIASTVGVNKLGGYALRALCWCANFDALQRADAMTVVAKGDLALSKKIDWAKSFQSGPYAMGAIGLLNAIALFAAIRSDEEDTKKKVFAIMNSAAGLGSASIQFAQAFVRAMNVGKLGAVAGFTGRALGTLGGFISAGLGAVQALDEKDSGDDLGFWLAAVGAGAAYAASAGFIIGGGMAGASGIGAPVGAVLMTIGVVIGLGAGILQVWRDIFTSATHTVVEAMVKQYERVTPKIGAYARAHDKPGAKALHDAFEAVKTAHHPGLTGFMPHIDADPKANDPETNLLKPGLKDGGIELLYDAGFDKDAIELIVDDTKSTKVMTRLMERRDWPTRRNKQASAPPAPVKATTAKFVPIGPDRAAFALTEDATRGEVLGFTGTAPTATAAKGLIKQAQMDEFLDLTSGLRIFDHPDYYPKCVAHLTLIYNCPSGKELLRRIKATGKIVNIDRSMDTSGVPRNSCKDYDKKRAFGTIIRAQKAWAITKNELAGSGCTVEWSPSRVKLGNTAPWQHVPPAILLGHELCHAMHACRGEMLNLIDDPTHPDSIDDEFDPDPSDGKTKAQVEELITVGIGIFETTVCENSLRRELFKHNKIYDMVAAFPRDANDAVPQRPCYFT